MKITISKTNNPTSYRVSISRTFLGFTWPLKEPVLYAPLDTCRQCATDLAKLLNLDINNRKQFLDLSKP